jgi:hypothetical protein
MITTTMTPIKTGKLKLIIRNAAKLESLVRNSKSLVMQTWSKMGGSTAFGELTLIQRTGDK